ncbi:MAG: thrombospondin type 3 repeat-containing protein, partial [Polyangia bacterium]|nr:thrombospondin type 3 repeat-containing protein [Polyangia bacterium]
MHNYMYSSDGYWDASWYYDPAHPERNVLVEAAAGETGLTPEQYGPNGCVRTYFDYCELVDPDEVPAVDFITTPNSLCQICEVAGHWIPRDVTVSANAFPGVWVVSARVGDDLWDSPGLRFQSKLERGLREMGWLNANDNGQAYSAACHLQAEIASRLDPSLEKVLPEGCRPDESGLCISFRELIAESGGVRISGNRRVIDLLVPPLQPRPIEAATPAGCSPRPFYTGLTGTAASLSMALDFPKVANVMLAADDGARQFGIHIACNQGMSCALDNDDDEDGWCNDVDLCPGFVTGANCDSDDGIGLGDGVGDGDPTLWSNCLVAIGRFPPAQRHTEAYQRVRQFYCGGCDNCQGVSNPEVYPDLPDHSWYHVRYPDQSAGNPNTVTLPTRQLDFDRDWIGDACDPDIDGDGIRNEFDCDDHNGCLGLDLDQDTVCDSYGSHFALGGTGQCDSFICSLECLYWAVRLGNFFDVDTCTERCKVEGMDNCAAGDPISDPYCRQVYTRCVFPNDLDVCDPIQVARCAMRYGNSTQDDTFGVEGVGDKCELGIGSLSLEQDFSGHRSVGHGLPLGMIWREWGDTYSVRMRLWGGDVGMDSGGAPTFVGVDRTAVEVGACACTPGNHHGWQSQCGTDFCPRRAETDQYDEVAWNPVHAPEIATGHQEAGGQWQYDYPVYCGPPPWSICDDMQQCALGHDLVYGRRMPFSLDERANAFAFTWDWRNSRQVPAYSSVRNYDFQQTGWTTALRAAWPNWVAQRNQTFYDNFYDHLVTYTEPIPVQITTSDYSGYAYFGPAFVTRLVDYWPDGKAEFAKGWMIATDPIEGL